MSVCVEVVHYKGESQIHLRNRDEGVMLTKTHWENLVRLMQKYGILEYKQDSIKGHRVRMRDVKFSMRKKNFNIKRRFFSDECIIEK